jgi:hypothetical protein
MRGVKSPVGTLSSNRDEFKAAPPCIPPPPCAPPYPYASVGAVGVGTGVLKAAGAGTLSDDAAYPPSPPVSEGVLTIDVDIDVDEAGTPCGVLASPKAGIPNAAGSGMGTARGVGCTSPPRSRAGVGTCDEGSARATPGCEGRKPEVGRACSCVALALASALVLALRDEGAELDASAASASSVLSPGGSGMGDWTSWGVFRSASASAAVSAPRVDTEGTRARRRGARGGGPRARGVQKEKVKRTRARAARS